jgi:hypothetical protein
MWATVTVAIGVALEAVELFHDTKTWMKRRQTKKKELADLREVAEICPASEVTIKTESTAADHPKWVKVMGRLGLIAVVVGVLAESRFGIKLEDAHNAIHARDMALLTDAKVSASDAATSARSAHDEADTVKNETAAIEGRLGKASTQLTGLEEEILLQAPRWGLLKRGENDFIEALTPFAGQKATVVICGQDEGERWVFEEILLGLLHKAGWSTGYQPWQGCPTMLSGGNEIYFVSAADTVTQWVMPYPCGPPCPAANEDKVARAGRALNDILRKLKIGTHSWMVAPPRFANDEQAFARAREFFSYNNTLGSPAELALREPTTIFILIGPRPPEFGMQKSKPVKAKRAQ